MKNKIGATIAILVTLGFLVVVGVLFWRTVPTENKDLFSTALSTLSYLVVTAVAYYLGSSEGSARKTELFKSPEVPPQV